MGRPEYGFARSRDEDRPRLAAGPRPRLPRRPEIGHPVELVTAARVVRPPQPDVPKAGVQQVGQVLRRVLPAHDGGVPGSVARGDVLAPRAPGIAEGREPLAAV